MDNLLFLVHPTNHINRKSFRFTLLVYFDYNLYKQNIKYNNGAIYIKKLEKIILKSERNVET